MASAFRLPVPRPYGSDTDLENILEAPIGARRLNVVVVGAHPDDPETGCGGTVAKLAGDGHRVSMVYLTRGEAGLKNGDKLTAACLRTAEALNAADILGVEAVFANQIDGETSSDASECARFTELLRSLLPDVVFTHWPQDTHRDHRIVAELTQAAWEALGRSFALVYYEVMAGIQTYDFQPNLYVDVSGTEEQKREAVYAHVCQNPNRFYPYHVNMERQRAAEAGLDRAEAFVVVRDNPPATVIPFPDRCRA